MWGNNGKHNRDIDWYGIMNRWTITKTFPLNGRTFQVSMMIYALAGYPLDHSVVNIEHYHNYIMNWDATNEFAYDPDYKFAGRFDSFYS